MVENWMILLTHQLIFQGMFMVKNYILQQKNNQTIRGRNAEATAAIIFFVIFITTAFILAVARPNSGSIDLAKDHISLLMSLICLLASLYVSARSLIDLKESWRVGVIENQKTVLITNGIYRLTRNPYFLSYLLMFSGYAILLKNILLFLLLIPTALLIHRMILKEENFLIRSHGQKYIEYKKKVPRYLIF